MVAKHVLVLDVRNWRRSVRVGASSPRCFLPVIRAGTVRTLRWLLIATRAGRKICQCPFAGAEANSTRFRRSIGLVGPGVSFLNFLIAVVGWLCPVHQGQAESDSCFAVALPGSSDGGQGVVGVSQLGKLPFGFNAGR